MSEDFALPDEILDKHLADTSAEEEAPELDEEDESPEADEDTNEPSEDEDTDEDESGDDDPDDESDEDEDEDTDEPESFLPKFDRKKIEADPDLNAAYKHMQAAFTKAQQETRGAQREIEQQRLELQSFVEELATDDGAEDLLVQVALNRPEVFRRAVERAEELSEDPSELKKYERETDIKRREKELSQREMARRAEEQERRVAEIESLVDRTAGKLGMTDADIMIAHEYVANEIFKIRSAGGEDITPEAVVKAVKRAADHLSIKTKRTREEAEREAVKKERSRARAKVRANNRPKPPRSSTPPASRRTAEAPKGVDPLVWAIDQAFAE